tara:strand:- start:344 stop:502 length:159 start_codon:yes stop_codon:yes gene_type:complete
MFDLLAKISYYIFINGLLAQLDRAQSYDFGVGDSSSADLPIIPYYRKLYLTL